MKLAFFYSLLLHACCAHAGLPPTTLKGQSDATQPTTFNYQVPFFQSTRTASTNALIETGNTNILANPGFEHTTATTSWTASGGTTATDTSTQLIGLKSVTWDSNSASQTFTSTAVAIPRGLYGRNGEASCLIQVASGTATHTLQAFDGTNILASQTINNSTLGTRTAVNFIMPSSGNIQLRLVSVAADEPLIEIDECYLGEATNLSQISQATFVGGIETTPSAAGCIFLENTSSGLTNFVALGTGTSCNAWTAQGSVTAQATNDHRAVYNNMPPGNYQIVLNGAFFTSTAGQCNWRLSDGTNTFQPQVIGASGGTATSPMLVFYANYTSAANRTFALQAADDHAGNCSWSVTANFNASWKFYRFPGAGELAVRMDQSNYDWIDGGAITIGGTTTAPTKPSTGITRDKVFYKREGQNLLIRYEYQQTVNTGAAAGSGDYLFQIPTASGCTIDTNRIGTSTTVGANSLSENTVVVGASSAGSASPSAATGIVSVFNSTNLRFMITTTPAGTAQSLGSTVFQLSAANIRFAAQASVPCVGWQENRGAPLLVGSVTSSSSGMERMERASWTVACTSSPCVNAVFTPGITSVTRSGTGQYVVNFATGTWSAIPTCVMNGTGNKNTFNGTPTLTTFAFTTLTSADAFFDAGSIAVICMGPR